MVSEAHFNLTQIDGKPCAHTCRITYNKSALEQCDAVVFHNRDMPGAQSFQSIEKQRTQRQRWIYFTQENPQNVGGEPAAKYNGIFNWTITYRRDSDIVYPYGSYREITANEVPNDHHDTNYAKGKDNLIAWTVSHCGTPRDRVATKLSEFVPVSVYGLCSRLFPNKNKPLKEDDCPRYTEQCSKILRTFKFYLALENGIPRASDKPNDERALGTRMT
ncbi:hypothetical protein QZH41_007363 [Actinostola sp. cb2023]|nr:hypothetical protein QZH41_007363 [Actinostola sp. cb2023]